MSGGDGEWVTRQVTNPDYTDLVELMASARAVQSSCADLLDQPAGLMGSGEAWTGPSTASAFAGEVQGRKTGLPGHFEVFVNAIAYRMSRVPRTVEHRTQVW